MVLRTEPIRWSKALLEKLTVWPSYSREGTIMERDCSLPCSQQPVIDAYHEPDHSSPHTNRVFILKYINNIILRFTSHLSSSLFNSIFGIQLKLYFLSLLYVGASTSHNPTVCHKDSVNFFAHSCYMLRTLFSNTLSHPYRTTDKIIVLYIQFFFCF
jgi:hypothetical protein